MDKKILQDIHAYILREKGENFCNIAEDDEFEKTALVELQKTLSSYSETNNKDYNKKVKEINNFINSGDIQKRKLLYCSSLLATKEKLKIIKGEEVVFHKYLSEDTLSKLCRYIKDHKEDDSFTKTVNKIMKSHGIENPALIYKAALMRRQDYSRATDPNAKNIPKMLVWQIIIGLHCSLEEADEILFSAGYIRRNTSFDLTMQYFIVKKNYDIMAINAVLYDLGLKVFSCYKAVKNADALK